MMNKYYKNFLYLIFILGVLFSFKDSKRIEHKKKYLIISFEKTNSKELHKSRIPLWIIEVDSLDTDKNLAPLYIYEYSNSFVTRCKNDSIVNPFIIPIDDNNNFDEDFLATQELFPTIVTDNKTLLLTIKKKFKNGIKERIKMYITPVEGIFCDCPLESDKRFIRINYTGRIYLPLKNISFDSSYNINNVSGYSLQKKINLSEI